MPPLRITNFDKYNPFTLKGTSPPGLGALVFESLLTGTMDEPTTAYGLLAEDVEVAADGLSATFRLNPPARFHDGTPVMAADVKHSFDTLMSKQAAPQYRVVFGDVRAGRGHRAAHRALRLQARQRRAAAAGRRPAGIQPRLGRGQALRPGDHRHADRERPVQDRPAELRPRHHLSSATPTTGRAI